jgi:pimeloyl-ACP methyl ester carboxylesterase
LATRFTVLAPDVPGSGASALHPRASCSTLAADLAAVLDREAQGPALVVGNSFGAALAWQLGADHKDRVERLLLVNGGPLPPVPAWLRRVLGGPPLAGLATFLLRRASFRRLVVERALVDPSAFPPGFVERAVAGGGAAARIGFDAVRYQSTGPRRPEAPVALLWGAADTLLPMARARRLAQRLGTPLKAMAGAGHLPQVQDPAGFADAVLDWAGSEH